MNVIANTASNYFSPTLGAISDKLKLPYDIAGVTFLALGNGSPDFFSLIASFSGGVDVLVGVGALLGGSVFVCTVVVGAIAILCPCDVTKDIFLRDVSFHLFATICVTVIACVQNVNIYIALGLIVVYIIYVLFVVVASKRTAAAISSGSIDGGIPMTKMPVGGAIQTAFWHKSDSAKPAPPKSKKSNISKPNPGASSGGYNFLILKETKDQDASGEKGPDAADDEESTINLSGGYMPEFDLIINEDYCAVPHDHSASPGTFTIEDAGEDEEQQGGVEVATENPLNHSLLGASGGEISVQRQLKLAGGVTRGVNRTSNYQSVIQSLYWQQWILRRQFRKSLFSMEEWNGMSWPQRVVYLCELPVTFLRDITIPTLDQQNWSKLYAIIHPFADIVFVAFLFGYITESFRTIPVILISLALAVVPSFAVYLLTHTAKPPTGPLFGAAWALAAFVMCIFWIYMLANELIACLSSLGEILKLPPAFLGLTVLAWGNSVGDLFTNTAVARQDLGEMALAGCYGGPVFNILMGFGTSLVYASSKSYPDTFTVRLDASSIVSIVFLFIALTSTMAIVASREYRIERWFGIYLLTLYGLYTVCQFLLLLFV